MNILLIPSQVSSFYLSNSFFIVNNISEKPNHITPSHPYKKVAVDNLHDDVVDRAFRLDAMRRKIQSAGLQPRQKYPYAQTANQDIGWYSNPLVP